MNLIEHIDKPWCCNYHKQQWESMTFGQRSECSKDYKYAPKRRVEALLTLAAMATTLFSVGNKAG